MGDFLKHLYWFSFTLPGNVKFVCSVICVHAPLRPENEWISLVLQFERLEMDELMLLASLSPV